MRVLGAVALLISVSGPEVLAQAGGASDRAQLIEGVREVAAPGSLGSLAVFSTSASALVTGTSDGGADLAVIACGHLGRGRVVVLAHDGYFGEGTVRVEVKIAGAVAAPFYRLGATTTDAWRSEKRHHPAPWAELVGKNVIFTVPSFWVRELDDPKEVLTLWDEIVAAQDAFVSLPRRERPERIVADVQISAGYMHAGYPVMVPIDDSVRSALRQGRLRREGNWGIFHELGHNHQRGDWTFDGTGEVTNNLIVLYVFDKVLGLRFDSGHEAIRDRNARNRRIRAFWAKGSPFAEWKNDPFLALMMYIQLYEAFGAEPFAKVFADYAHLPDAQRPKSDDDKRDQWMVRMSKATGKNLGPFFVNWGVPTSQHARDSIACLPAWMPPGFTSVR